MPRLSPRARYWLVAALACGLVWELVGRPLLCIIFPGAPIPDPLLKEILSMLAMLGM